MRSPVIAFSLLAAAAVSPTLVAGAPTSPNPNSSIRNSARALPHPLDNLAGSPSLPNGHNLNAVPRGVPDLTAPVSAPNIESLPVIGKSQGGNKNDKEPSLDQHRAAEQQLHNPSSSSSPIDAYTSHSKRAQDQYTAGGNSSSGATTDTSGGSVVNISKGGFGEDDDGEPDIINDGGNTGGNAGGGFSGFSYGGDGDGKGAGGNAYSGAVGPSEGGDVINLSKSGIANEEPNTGGTGGFNESGDSQGGDASKPPLPHHKRAQDQYTAGGNAYSGASSNVDGGNVVNKSKANGETFNDAPNTGGNAGQTYSGQAYGGDGNGFGPGGNAYSGAAGSAVGGSVVNIGGSVDIEAPQTGGMGGLSQSGDAVGGDA